MVRNKIIFYGWIGNLFKILCQALYFILLSHILDIKNYGIFSTAFTYVNFFSPFANLGTANLLLIKVSRRRQSFQVIFPSALVTTIFCGTIMSILSYIISYVTLPSEVRFVIPLIGLSELVFFRIIDLCAQSFQANDRVFYANIIYIMCYILRIAAGFLLLFNRPDLLFWCIAYFGVSLLSSIISLYLIIKSNPGIIRSKPKLRAIKATAASGLAYSFGIASSSFYADIDKILLAKYVDMTISGYYNSAFRLLLLGLAPLQSLIFSLNTRIYRTKFATKEYYKLIYLFISIVFLFTSVSYALYFIFSENIITLLGRSYSGARQILYYMLPLIPLTSIGLFLGDLANSLSMQRQKSVLQISIAVYSLLAGVFLIGKYGWHGAICMAISAQIILIVSYIFLIKPHSRK